MAKKTGKAAPSKTLLKVTNKKTNKLNKQKQRIKKAGKGGANGTGLKKAHKENAIKKDDDEELKTGKSFVRDYFEEQANFDPGSINKRKNKRKVEEDLDGEDVIENKYKASKQLIKNLETEKRVKLALPIKTRDGMIVENYARFKEIDEIEEVQKRAKQEEEAKSSIEPPAEPQERPKTAMDLIREKSELLEKNKEKIAYLSRSVISNPQEEMKKLRELRTMLTLPEIRSSYLLQKLIIVSLCEIFKDIMPSYKIRAWTDKENTQNISNDVKELKEYEEALLKQYKMYLDYLGDSLKNVFRLYSSAKKAQQESIIQYGVVVFKCHCMLIEKLTHFNYALDIIETIINQLTSKLPQLSAMAFDAIKNLFKNDKTLELSLDITYKISRMLRQRSYGVKAEVLDIFLSLKLREIQIVEEEKAKKLTHKEKMKMSRTDRKNLKEKEQLEKDLEEKKLNDSLKIKSKLQTRILEQLFAIYFRILKKSANSKLIPSVLEGLSKFAHLINLDFFEDLLKLMHQMIESDGLSSRSKLHIIKTVFIVLSGQGEALTLDPMKFYTSLYGLMLNLNAAGSLDNVYLLTDCIEMMFFKRRKQIPTARLLAFIKRMGVLALHLQPNCSAVVLHTLRKMINLNKQSDLLFDNDYQDSGIYNPFVNEPDYVNAQNSALWELHLLRKHYSVPIGNEASNLLRDQSITLEISKLKVHELVAEMNKYDEVIFQEPVKIKKNKRYN